MTPSAQPGPTLHVFTLIESSGGPAGTRAGPAANRPRHRGAAVCTGDHQQPAQAAATESQLTGSACSTPRLAATCTLPSDCPGAASDLPTLTLCVDVGQAALASADPASHNAGIFGGSNVAESSIWVQCDRESEPTDEGRWFSLEQRPHVVACPLLALSDSLPDLSLKLPHRTCLVLDSRSAVLDVHRAKFEGVSSHSHMLNCICVFKHVQPAELSSTLLFRTAGNMQWQTVPRNSY